MEFLDGHTAAKVLSHPLDKEDRGNQHCLIYEFRFVRTPIKT